VYNCLAVEVLVLLFTLSANTKGQFANEDLPNNPTLPCNSVAVTVSAVTVLKVGEV
jgi:hypothetical protein